MNEKQTNQVKPASVANESQVKPMRPTKKQKELLGFIEQFIAEHGYSPSYREIMSGLQYTSVATVALHVGNLIKRGHLVKRDHSARSLEVVNPTGAGEKPLLTNQITESEEKWLVGKVEKLFADAESQASPMPQQVDDIAVVLAALKVIGLEAVTQNYAARLTTLRSQLPKL